jgi:HEAT repeat protein
MTLRERIIDPDRRVRRDAVNELQQLGGDESAELLGIALDDENRIVRFRALEALGAVGGPTALRLLLERMDDPSQPTLLRRMALDAVVTIGTPEAADALEARLDTFDSRRGRKLVARKVARMRSPG